MRLECGVLLTRSGGCTSCQDCRSRARAVLEGNTSLATGLPSPSSCRRQTIAFAHGVEFGGRMQSGACHTLWGRTPHAARVFERAPAPCMHRVMTDCGSRGRASTWRPRTVPTADRWEAAARRTSNSIRASLHRRKGRARAAARPARSGWAPTARAGRPCASAATSRAREVTGPCRRARRSARPRSATSRRRRAPEAPSLVRVLNQAILPYPRITLSIQPGLRGSSALQCQTSALSRSWSRP
eukprot:1499905-Prymnesium_polylepis.2